MAKYDRHCTACDNIFEVTCKIAEKDDPHPCPSCESTDGEWYVGAPMFAARSDRLMTMKQDNGFKEVLAKIAERNPRTEVAKR